MRFEHPRGRVVDDDPLPAVRRVDLPLVSRRLSDGLLAGVQLHVHSLSSWTDHRD